MRWKGILWPSTFRTQVHLVKYLGITSLKKECRVTKMSENPVTLVSVGIGHFFFFSMCTAQQMLLILLGNFWDCSRSDHDCRHCRWFVRVRLPVHGGRVPPLRRRRPPCLRSRRPGAADLKTKRRRNFIKFSGRTPLF